MKLELDDKCIIIFNSDVFNINIVERVVNVLNYNDYLTVVIVYNYECNMQMYLLHFEIVWLTS